MHTASEPAPDRAAMFLSAIMFCIQFIISKKDAMMSINNMFAHVVFVFATILKHGCAIGPSMLNPVVSV